MEEQTERTLASLVITATWEMEKGGSTHSKTFRIYWRQGQEQPIIYDAVLYNNLYFSDAAHEP